MADTIKRNTTLTLDGMNLYAKVQTGKPLKITRVWLGDGKIPDGFTVKEMKMMVNPILELPVVDFRLDGVGTSVMECEKKNADLAYGFFARELGIYARDPDTEAEVLYAYRNVGDYAEYVPAAMSGEIVNDLLSIITVVGQCENVEITITDSMSSLSRVEHYEHVKDTNPHPNFLQVGNQITEAAFIFATKGEARRLERLSMSDLRTQILGANSSTLPIINGRLNQLELELANIGIRNMVTQELSLSNTFVYEDFNPADEIDNTTIKINSVTAGSRSIDLESLDGLIEGSWYTIADGVRKEDVQIKSLTRGVGKNVYRVITNSEILNTYNVDDAFLYRSTSEVITGRATGSSDRRAVKWSPSTVWKGISAQASSVIALESTLDKADNFTLIGSTMFTANGFMTLDTTAPVTQGVSVQLVATGGGKGTWKLLDANGVNYVG